MLLPVIARVIPSQMASLVRFTEKHGGSPMLYNVGGQVSAIKDVEYYVEEREMRF